MHSCPAPVVLFRTLIALAGIGLIPPAIGADATGPAELKAQVDRWIELEQRIADERNAWRADQEILTASVGVLEKEKTALQTRLEGNELASTAFKNRLAQAEAELVEQDAIHRALEEACAGLETRIAALTPRLPPILQERIAPMLAKLQRPPDDEPVPVSERTQSVVSVLTTIDQFNNTLTLTHELRPGSGGETLDVKVLYWGLTTGYAIDASGTQAWIVTPGPSGWEWREARGEAPAIQTLVATYEKQQSPEFVMLPLRLEGGAP